MRWQIYRLEQMINESDTSPGRELNQFSKTIKREMANLSSSAIMINESEISPRCEPNELKKKKIFILK